MQEEVKPKFIQVWTEDQGRARYALDHQGYVWHYVYTWYGDLHLRYWAKEDTMHYFHSGEEETTFLRSRIGADE